MLSVQIGSASVTVSDQVLEDDDDQQKHIRTHQPLSDDPHLHTLNINISWSPASVQIDLQSVSEIEALHHINDNELALSCNFQLGGACLL